jgi:multicomponent Na+:H+ antiporter subunit D
MNSELAWAVLVPLVGAVLSFLAGRRAGRWVAGIATLGTLCAASTAAVAVGTRGPLRHLVGGWGPSLGITLRADGLAAVMLLTIGVVGALISTHVIRDRSTDSRLAGSFFSLWLFAWAALNALVLSADIFNLYVTLELATLAAVALIAIGGDREALTAGLRYLLFALPGSLVYLLGVALLYGMHASLDVTVLGARVAPGPVT